MQPTEGLFNSSGGGVGRVVGVKFVMCVMFLFFIPRKRNAIRVWYYTWLPRAQGSTLYLAAGSFLVVGTLSTKLYLQYA